MISLRAKIEDAGHDVDTFSSATIEAFRHALAGIAKATQAEWIRLAQSRLRTSRTDYINGLRQAESFAAKVIAGEPIYEIKLVGRMPNAYEFGMAPFDMKAVRPGWLGGSKAKTNARGKKYVVIPFRHSTTSSARLGYSGKALRDDLKTELKRTVKNYGLNRMVRNATGGVRSGSVARVPRSPSVHRYLHGLTRIQKPHDTNPNQGSGQLMTFRIMSEDSPADSWLHPGIRPANLLQEAERFANNELANIVNIVLGAAS